MSWEKVQYFALVWILIVLGAVIASTPLAWRVLEGPGPEKILGWVVIMVILSLPSLVLLAYARQDAARNREVSKWLHDEYEDLVG